MEEFADKQKELESTIQPIMTRLYQGAPSAADLLTTCASLKPPVACHKEPAILQRQIWVGTIPCGIMVQAPVARAQAAACPAVPQVP